MMASSVSVTLSRILSSRSNCFARSSCADLETRIGLDLQRSRVALAEHRQPHLIRARQRHRTLRAAAPERRVRHFGRSFIAQIPDEAIQSGIGRQVFCAAIALEKAFLVARGLFFLGKFADYFSGGVENFERDLRRFVFFLLVVQLLVMLLRSSASTSADWSSPAASFLSGFFSEVFNQ